MNAAQMYYDGLQKLNEVDSNKWKRLKVPEWDWKINEAQDLFVKMVAEPRLQREVGFEVNQRTIDDIRTIVVDQKESDYIIPVAFDTDLSSYTVALPTDYWFLAKLKVIAKKGECTALLHDSKPVQHDDETESSTFERSSFEWRAANYRFNSLGLRVFTDKTFTIEKVGLEYLKRPRRIWNAASWEGGTYTGLDGIVYTGMQDCELSVGVHSDIVDLAVFIISGDLNLPSYQIKQNKLSVSR